MRQAPWSMSGLLSDTLRGPVLIHSLICFSLGPGLSSRNPEVSQSNLSTCLNQFNKCICFNTDQIDNSNDLRELRDLRWNSGVV